MNEEQQRAEMRLKALEYMVALTYNLVLRHLPYSEDQISAVERLAVERMGLQATGISDPVMSDHISGMFQDALHKLQAQARQMRTAG